MTEQKYLNLKDHFYNILLCSKRKKKFLLILYSPFPQTGPVDGVTKNPPPYVGIVGKSTNTGEMSKAQTVLPASALVYEATWVK